MLTLDNDQRVIIQTDIDFFYGQVEELENPGLKGQPFGVQQKHIIVTCNYLARERGVRKLQILTEALKTCPELVIVNGEDLTRYRAASKSIFQLARSLVWGEKVERLGLDELFMDVTDMIDAHLTELGWGGDNGATVVLEKKQTFHVKVKQQEMFTYNPYTWVGFKVDKEGDRMSQSTESQERLSWDTVKLHAASHLALYIRSQIMDRLGFTCSAGIASSKLLAKLAADAHKPNEQTLLCPDMYNDFILPLEIRKIMGIGHKAAHTICEKLGFIKDAQQSLITEEEEDNNVASLDVTELPAQMAEDWHLPQLTVSYVQKNCTIKQFVNWFGDRQGQHLWDLIYGKDRTAVVPTPLIPTQISIEDSFRQCSTLQEAITKLHELSISFIKRLEVELRTENEWLKYPTTLRLTTRNRSSKNSRAWKDTRISKSKRMPVDVFDIESSVEERASALVEQSLSPMLKNLVKEPFDLTLLNIAAAHLSVKRPAISIQGMFAKSVNALEHGPIRPDDVDEATWSDLPLDIQREIAQHSRPSATLIESENKNTDHLVMANDATSPQDDTSANDVIGPIENTMRPIKRKHSDSDIKGVEDIEFAPSVYESMVMLGDDEEETLETCNLCGNAMFVWAMQAHILYHEKEGDNE